MYRDSKGRFCKKEETVYMTGYKAFNSDFSCRTAVIDGKNLKEDVFYRLRNNNFIER